MTRPRIAGVGDDEVAPPPEDEVRQVARPREPDQRAELVGVVDGREQVGRAADAHRREPGQRLVARRLDPDPALDVRADRDRVEGRPAARRHPPSGPLAHAVAARSLDRRIGQGLARGRGQDQLRDGVGGSRPAERPRRLGHRAWATGSSRMPPRRRSAAASNASSVDDPRRAGLGEARRRSPAGGRPHADTGRRPSAARAPSPRPASTSRPARRPGPPRERRQHLVAQERVRPVARAQLGRAAPRDRRAPRRSPRRRSTWMTVTALDQPRQRLGHGGVEAADRLRAAEDQQDPLVRRRCPSGARASSRSIVVDVADRRARHVARPAGAAAQSVRQVASNETASAVASRAVARTRAAGDDVAVPHDDRDAAAARRPSAPAPRRSRRS